MELQKVCFAKNKCCKRFFFALIGKDMQRYSKYFTKIYEMLEFCLSVFQMSVRKGSLEGTIQVPWNLRAKTCNAKSCWRNIFSKADHLERKNQEGTNWQRAKEQRLLFIHSLVRLPVFRLGSVNLLAAAPGGFWFSFDQRLKSQHNCCHNGHAKFLLNFVEQNPWVTSVTSLVKPYSLLSTMAVTLSVEKVRGTWKTSNRAISNIEIFQHRQLNW